MSITAPFGPRTYRPRLTGEARRAKARELARDYKGGSTIRGLALSAGLSYGTVRTLLREEGVELRPRGGHAPMH
ncbi:helix-turn-helix domain-containing protein [Streptomyces halobius]|uniref:Transcriptional regulator n=1 Tax=Streptomyces halobius TaxID=2879846 RepID=A0ABY4MD70_9ACTN|nr:helix-turn-helix domain-containing protein [Streptomyces halobius]UQA95719.1 transcriptional regulator [Streptomyces halobius]